MPDPRPLVRIFASVMVLMGSTAACARPPVPPAGPAPASQNPSPMTETTRAHERIVRREVPGIRATFAGPGGRDVDVLVPVGTKGSSAVDVVIHFHGASWVPQQAVGAIAGQAVSAVVNLGAGSGSYHRAFADPAAFDSLLAGIVRTLSTGADAPTLRRVTLTAFSAGHGAVRAILREPRHFARVGAVLLLDGMHTSYVPERTPLADGGTLDTANLTALARFAQAAVAGEKRFVVTHSEIFPGTFASTTETADWLLAAIGLRRTPVLRWGPRGMQQLSEARERGFLLLGYAGNSAPDHVDHLHAMREMLALALGH